MHASNDASKRDKAVICPYCGSGETELFALFGQQLLTVQYYCRACHTPFEHIKDDDMFDGQTVTRSSASPDPGNDNGVFSSERKLFS